MDEEANRQDEIDESARATRLRATFEEAFGAPPEFIARAPGRVNLIGEHTDYNGGFVLPVAIDRTVLVAALSLPEGRRVEMVSLNYGNRDTFSLDDITHLEDEDKSWSNYVRGVASALEERGHLSLGQITGAQLVIEGNVPEGAGLSSSAAIEVASALVFTRLAGVRLKGETLALTCQRAENEFVGVKSGIMDQFISALGQTDSALLIDTRSLEYEVVPLGFEELGYKVVAVDSAAPRTLAGSAYNQRTVECAEAMQILQAELDLPGGAQLRDVSLAQLEAQKPKLLELLYRRARHVVGENERTLEAVALMREGLGRGDNLRRFGELLYASHYSLRDDYEVSSKELDLLVELASRAPGVVGARMTGAGFGGCTVNIVQAEHLAEFQRLVVEEYRQQTGRNAALHVCQAVQGGSYLD
ncbi:MAG: galactokinase [Chloroflexota bacterium]|nr:galactokinase [Chloroflexota bacterium]MDQ5865897.1 galactokinase [Chloroflexota bacterium]